MRNLYSGPRFSLFAATMILMALVVRPISCTEDEIGSYVSNHQKRKIYESDDLSLKAKRSLNFPDGGHNPDKIERYSKWDNENYESGDDRDYGMLGNGDLEYENDGYGYDDDEYDHVNYKRYDTDNNKISQDPVMNPAMVSKAGPTNAKGMQDQTIEMLNFQAKNINPSEAGQAGDKNQISTNKKTMFPKQGESSKESLSDFQLKKKTSNNEGDQKLKAAGNAAEKGGSTKSSENSASEKTESGENGHGKLNKLGHQKDSVAVSDAKETGDSQKFDDETKNDGKLTRKDASGSADKLNSEGKEGKNEVKIKDDKDVEASLSDSKSIEDAGKEDSRDKNLSHLVSNSANLVSGGDYKEPFDNLNEACMPEESTSQSRYYRGSEPVAYSGRSFSVQYVRKKDVGGDQSRLNSKDQKVTKDDNSKSALNRGPKEPFRLDFPLAEIENTDYHRNFLKSLKRYKGIEDSSHILSQGDTPNPYTDDARCELSSRVIEDEQKKRRSRLSRLKSSPLFGAMIKGSGDVMDAEYDTDYDASNAGLEDVDGKSSTPEVYCDGWTPLSDRSPAIGAESNLIRKRQGNVGFYDNDRRQTADFETQLLTKRKSASDSRNPPLKKSKYKEYNFYEEQPRCTSPLVLLQKSNSNGVRTLKTFSDGKYRDDDKMDPEEMARLLSRDGNYVVLKKASGKADQGKGQESGYGGMRPNEYADPKRKDKFKATQFEVMVSTQKPLSMDEMGTRKFFGSYTEAKLDEDSMKRMSEGGLKDLGDLFTPNEYLPGSKFSETGKRKEPFSMSRMSLVNKKGFNKGTYRHVKPLEVMDKQREMVGQKETSDKQVKIELIPADTKSYQQDKTVQGYKKDGKEYSQANKPFQLTGQKSKMHENGVANAGQTGMMGSGIMQIRLPEIGQKAQDTYRNYYLYGNDNSMNSAPKHEIQVSQSDLGYIPMPGNPYGTDPGNMLVAKTGQAGKAVPADKSPTSDTNRPGAIILGMQPVGHKYGSGASQQRNAGIYKRTAKKEGGTMSSNLRRFMRDFQNYKAIEAGSRGYENEDMSGMTLQELTSHGDKQLQKLNSLLKEIMNNKAETINEDGRKNTKRGMFQKYKDSNNWRAASLGVPVDQHEIHSGKWTSMADGVMKENQLRYGERNTDSVAVDDENKYVRENARYQRMQKREDTGRGDPGEEEKSSKHVRSKRKAEDDCESEPRDTRSIEVKLRSSVDQNGNSNQIKRSVPDIPQELLLDLLRSFGTEIDEASLRGEDPEPMSDICQRYQSPLPEHDFTGVRRRRLLSVDAAPQVEGSINDKEKEKGDCIRKSFERYLDPLVLKITEFETKNQEDSRKKIRSKRRARKREIDLDESMPNDFQNFLVESVEGFRNPNREVVKKDEADWGSGSDLFANGGGNHDRSESSSILVKRSADLEKDEGKVQRSNDAKSRSEIKQGSNDETNIRIRIVDGNKEITNGIKGKEDEGTSRVAGEAKHDTDSFGDSSISHDQEKEGTSNVHEVYVITNADSKKRKKKKLTSARCDQSTQQSVPQVGTVYNSVPSTNHVRLEKLSDDHTNPVQVNYGSPDKLNSTIEDSIIRKNLRTGNINTFTYQYKEDPTPYPHKDPYHSATTSHSDFEMLEDRVATVVPGSTSDDHQDRDTRAKNSPEIIYKNENSHVYPHMMANRRPLSKKVFGQDEEEDEQQHNNYYSKGYHSAASYSDVGTTFANARTGQKLNADYKTSDDGNLKQGDSNVKANVLSPVMLEAWNSYTRSYSPSYQANELKDAVGGAEGKKYKEGNQFGGNGENTKEKKRLNDKLRLARQDKSSPNMNKREPVQIGRRFFYTFKTEIPDEEYLILYSEPQRKGGNVMEEKSEEVKKSDSQAPERLQQLLGSMNDYIQRKTELGDGQGTWNTKGKTRRRKRSVKGGGGKKLDKRRTSGHLTETNYRKHHKKMGNRKRGVGKLSAGVGSLREKREALAEFVKADREKRLEEEKRAREMLRQMDNTLRKIDKSQLVGSRLESPVPDSYPLAEEKTNLGKGWEGDNARGDQKNAPQQKSSPDTYKVFEIMRGRNGRGLRRKSSDLSGESIASRSEPETYKDSVFLNSLNSNKVKKFSDEGFESLTPNRRFSQISNSRYYVEEPSDGRTSAADTLLDERHFTMSNIVNRKTSEDRLSNKDVTLLNPPKQKFAHSISHEAIPLTQASALSSPKIFAAIKESAKQQDLGKQEEAKQPGLLRYPIANDRDSFRTLNHIGKFARREEENAPLTRAVLILTEGRGDVKRRARDIVTSMRDRERTRRERDKVQKRSVDQGKSSVKRAEEEIVNDSVECRSCGGETKTCNNKKTNYINQSPFPFRQCQNVRTDTESNGNGFRSGERILQSIMGKVDANPQFKRIIGPGLRSRSCKFNGGLNQQDCQSNPKSNEFVRQVRKIVTKFWCDIQKAAQQGTNEDCCGELNSQSKRFLYELLGASGKSCQGSNSGAPPIQSYLQSMQGGATDECQKVTQCPEECMSLDAIVKRRDLVIKLLDQYNHLPACDKERVAPIGEFLRGQLAILNAAVLKMNQGCCSDSDGINAEGQEERESSQAALACDSCEKNRLPTTTQKPTQSPVNGPAGDSGETRSGYRLPFMWSDPENLKLVKSEGDLRFRESPRPFDGGFSPTPVGFNIKRENSQGKSYKSELTDSAAFDSKDQQQPFSNQKCQASTAATRVPDEHLNKFEIPQYTVGTLGNLPEFSTSKAPIGELNKLSSGDAAGLQLSLKNHGQWVSNLDLNRINKNAWSQQPSPSPLPITGMNKATPMAKLDLVQESPQNPDAESNIPVQLRDQQDLYYYVDEYYDDNENGSAIS